MLVIQPGGSTRIRGVPQSEAAVITVVPDPITVPSSSVPVDYFDANLSQDYAAGMTSAYVVNVATPPSHPEFTLTNITPDVCDLLPSGDVHYKQSGTARISVQAWGGSRTVSMYMSSSNSSILRTVDYKAGTLGKHIVDTLTALVANKTPSDDTLARWASNNSDAVNPNVVQNPNWLLSGFDTSAISVCRGGQPQDCFPGLLISNRHILGAWHVLPGAGNWLAWKTTGGVYRTAKVVSSVQIGNDTGVAYLDTSIPDVTKFRLLPSDWRKYIRSQQYSTDSGFIPCYYGGLPGIHKTWNAPAGMKNSRVNIVTSFSATLISNSRAQANLTFDPWFYPIRGGDSGSPMMWPINGELVLIGAYYSAGGGGMNYADNALLINSAMNSLATAAGEVNPAYAVQTVSLAGFNNTY